MERAGYLWNYYGFTKLHIWGVHIVGGGLAGIGSGALTIAILRAFDHGTTQQVGLLLAFAGVAFLGCIAVVLASILSLMFFSGAQKLGILELGPAQQESKRDDQD